MIRTISMKQLESLLEYDADIGLLDVRSQEEFASGYLKGAVNIPIEELRERMLEIPKTRPVIVYCAHGTHSLMAARLLDQYGYDAVSAAGGLSAYRGRNFIQGTKQ